MVPIEGPTIPLAAPHAPFQAEATAPGRQVDAETTSAVGSFSEVLQGAVTGANDQILAAEGAAAAFAAGSRDDIHGTMLALSKADIQLRMVGNVRNKVVDAFYELWRMQI
jgi:flagellar hook-basal body complex protein FliE